MTKPPSDRRYSSPDSHPVAGLPVRADDIEPTRGLHSVAMLFRIMSGLMLLLLVVQVINGVTSTVPISMGVLVAEVTRLIIFAGLLWGAGDLADLFVKSHYDVRASRILLERLNHNVTHGPGPGAPRLDPDDRELGRGELPH